MKTQQHQNMRHSHSTKNYSFTTLSPTSSLPPICPQNNPNLNFFNPTHSGDLISLKKYLSNLNFQIHELKIAQHKLDKDNKQNKSLIQEAIALSKSTPHPINLQALLQESKETQLSNTNETQEQSNPNNSSSHCNASSSCTEKSTIPKESFQKLQTHKSIFCIRHEITYNKKVIKEKENEISNLKIELKVGCLTTKNNKLIDTTIKIQLLKANPNHYFNFNYLLCSTRHNIDIHLNIQLFVNK